MAAQYDDPYGDDLPPLDAYDASEAPATAPAAAGGFDPNSDEAFAQREAERQRERESLYSRLNPRQAEAVGLGPVSALVLAGAGSGKTSVLTARIAKLVSSGLVPARGILAVTFTNKAAQEMRHRLTKLLDKRSVNDMWSGTFHSLCNKLLRENFEAAGLPKSFAILDVDGQEALCRGILKDFGLTKASVKEAAKLKAASAQSDLLAANDPLAAAGGLDAADLEDDGELNEFVTPSQCAKYISARKEVLADPEPPASISTRSSDVEQMEAVYAEYQARCRKSGLLDFQDLLTRGVELLKNNPEVRDLYRKRFEAILVDEFQDTNDLQYEWLELLKSDGAFVMAVGDDSQSIYAFRGANPRNMQRFVDQMTVTRDAPEGRVVKLEQNYRSLPHILEAANAIIDRNTEQLKKKLFTSQQDRGERIDLVTYANGKAEAVSIADSIHRFIKQDGVQPAEIAVLYRTNQQSRLIEAELNAKGVPLTVYGGFKFYERQEIKVVLAYLDLVTDMTRDLSFAKVANIPQRGLGDRTIEELRQEAQYKRMSMMEAVGDRAARLAVNPNALGGAAAVKKHRALEAFTGVILDLADAATTMPLHKLVEELMERTGLKAHYEAEAGGSKSGAAEAEERLANIAELVSAARQFEIDNPQLTTAAEQLPEYMAYVALMTSTSESDMSRKNTVSLMTVHSSKGLEFDHVFIAGLEEATFPHSRAITEDEERGNGKSIDEALRDMGIDADDDGNALMESDASQPDGPGLQEERRLMYVAVTRARKTLTMTHARTRMMNGEIKPFEPSRFLEEIPHKRLNRIDDEKMRGPKKQWGRDNREYGGDAYDDTRARYQEPAAKAAAAPAAPRAELRTQESLAIPTRGQNRRVAIIGTAGRDKDKAHLMTKDMWFRMVSDARQRLQPGDTLVSGGAAWADHIAVKLFLTGATKNLMLHLPAPLGADGRFVGPDMKAGGSAASAANYYHELFKRSTGVDGLKDIAEAIAKGATVTCEPEAPGYGAMNARNRKVAMNSDVVLAYTWGQGAEPADGGTKQTWDMARDAERVHVPLGGLGASAPAKAPVAPASGANKPWEKPWLRRSAGEASAAPAAAVSTSGPSESTMRRLQGMGRRPMTPRPR